MAVITPVAIQGNSEVHALDITSNDELPSTTLCGLPYDNEEDTILNVHTVLITCPDCLARIG